MATPAKLVAPRPRDELVDLDIPLHPLRALTYFRLCIKKQLNPLFWSKLGKYRFDSPTASWGVCYAGETIASAFQEVYADQIRKGLLNYPEVAAYEVWRINVPQTMRTIKLAGPTLTRMKATLQSFVSGYKTSQASGRALMLNKADLDGLVYIGRRCGKPCLALFGDKTKPRPYQAQLTISKCRPINEWQQFWPLMDQLGVQFVNLPPTRANSTWEA